eukprot:NODE_12090_length_1246_cov_8.545130.p1 GENE.NODE_12090_length_1246_cov_8.545130~~NODE_12090_length_1246_cov_8.545130.p1  ORF type:complete len:207 (+),score=62.91 NODE_12090_length_1246_cov_8.545130:59-679(+)
MGAQCCRNTCRDPVPEAVNTEGKSTEKVQNTKRTASTSDGEPPSEVQVIETEVEMTIKPRSQQDRAEEHADMIFAGLTGDMDEEATKALEEETSKNPLSKDRSKIILRHTADCRMTCAQLKDMVKLVNLEAAKEEIIYMRYGHLRNREDFKTDVIHTFTRSEAMREHILEKLTARLIEDSRGKTEAVETLPPLLGQVVREMPLEED